MTQARLIFLASFGVAALSTGMAHAASAPHPAPSGAANAAVTSPAPLDASELQGMSGGQRVDINVGSQQALTATNSGNTVTGTTVGSGDVNLQQNAFANYSGIGNFVINTGHNNNLQGSISVNIATVPGR